MSTLKSPILPLLAAALSSACTDGNRIEVADPEPRAAIVETLVDGGVTSAVPVAPHRTVVAGTTGLWLLDPLAEAPVALDPVDATVLAAARTHDGGLVIATDQALWVWEDFLAPSALEDRIVLPVTALAEDGDDLWLMTSDGLRLWRAGWLHDIRIDDTPLSGPLTVAQGHTWVADASGVHGLTEVDGTWTVARGLPGARADALAASAQHVFAVRDGELWRRGEDRWTGFSFPTPVTGVWADPDAVGAWVRTEARWYHLAGRDPVVMTGVPELVGVTVDDAGRLLGRRDGDLVRVSATRTVVVAGLPETRILDSAVELRLLPTQADAVEAITVRVNGEDVEVLSEPWRVRLAPTTLGDGVHELTVHATWTDGEAVDATPVRFRAAGPTTVTWDDHVAPLYTARCAVCHDGGTETVLTGKDALQAQVDDVLDAVESGRMPLGAETLSDAEIGLIRQWKDGGFP